MRSAFVGEVIVIFLFQNMHTIPDTHQLYIMGDYHENSDLLTEILTSPAMMSEPVSLIMLGDYDAHTAAQLSSFEDVLSRYDVHCYLMRGNHDNPNLWQDRGIADIFETSKFKLLEDVDVLKWRGKQMLAVGGAVSVDRTCIRYDEGLCWPETEGIASDVLYQVKKLMSKGRGFDVLLTHTGLLKDVPVVNPFTESYASTDPNLLADLQKERDTITRIQMLSGIEEHYFGHFHRNRESLEYGISMHCLDICEVVQLE